MGDDAAVVSALTALRDISGAEVLDPVDTVLTHYGTDPYALGSYPYLAAGCSTADHDASMNPIADRVHFAGEATYAEDDGSVAGAMQSGRRVAEQILGRDVDPVEKLTWSG